MEWLFFLMIGFGLGYWFRNQKANTPVEKHKPQNSSMTYQQKIMRKAQHQSDSDRIRELNKLNRNESVFLRLLKQTFVDYEIQIKQKRFYLIDQDQMPCAIFEYRDGKKSLKMMDQEDGLPLFLYKGLISSEALKQDYLYISQNQNVRI